MANQSKPVILFLCSGNSARSQMAEGFLRHFASDTYEAHSAGLEPKPINPLTHQVMAEVGIDTTKQRSKSVSEYMGKVAVREAMIVCAKTQKQCPSIYPFSAQTHLWPFEDPAAFEGSDEMRLQKFRQVRDTIKEKILNWLDKGEVQWTRQA